MRNKLDKRFWIVWFSTFLFFSAFYSLIIPLPNYIKSLGLNDLQLGFIIGALGITSLITRPFAGILTDRYGRRKIVLYGVGIFISGVVLTMVTKSPLLLFMARSLQAIGYVAYTTAATTLIGDFTQNEKSGTSMAIYGAAANVAMTIIPLLINYLLKFTPLKITFLYSIALAFAGGILIMFSPDKIITNRKILPKLDHFKSIKKLCFPVITAISFGIGFGAFFQFVPLLNQRIESEPSGLIFLVFGISIIMTRILFKEIVSKVRRNNIIISSIILMSLSLLLFATAKITTLILCASVMISISCGLLHPLLLTIHLEQISTDKKGLGSAIFYFGFDIGIGMGAWILSPILLHLGISGLYISGAVLSIIGVIPALQMLKTSSATKIIKRKIS